MKLWPWARGVTNVAIVQRATIHPLCRELEGADYPQTAVFPAWYACRGGGINDTAVCSSTAGLYEGRTTLPNPEWTFSSSTTNSEFKTDPTISSTWWAFEGRREARGEENTSVKGPAWIDCNGYFAFGGEVDSDGEHRGKIRRVMQNEEVPSPELPLEPKANQHSPEINASSKGRREEDAGQTTDAFVRVTGEECNHIWTSWPAIQEAALARGTILVFDVFPSVGNLFIILHLVVKTARLLELALVLNWDLFPGFRAAFDPATIKWDLDPATFVQAAEQSALLGGSGPEVRRLYPFKFFDGSIILSHWQLQTVAMQLGIPATSAAELAAVVGENYSQAGMRVLSRDIVRNSPDSLQACAWNMLLRRSPSMMASLDAHNPWTPAGFGSRPAEYVAWHIRTAHGETKESFSPDVHPYIFNGQTSAAVFPLFLSATSHAEKACPKVYEDNIPIMPVYISSNSKSMSRNCTALAAENKIQSGFVDLGIADSDAHTGYSANPDATALNAFIDYLYLMDSSIMVHTGSSFSFTVASIKGTRCRGVPKAKDAPVRSLYICLPDDC